MAHILAKIGILLKYRAQNLVEICVATCSTPVGGIRSVWVPINFAPIEAYHWSQRPRCLPNPIMQGGGGSRYPYYLCLRRILTKGISNRKEDGPSTAATSGILQGLQGMRESRGLPYLNHFLTCVNR